MLVIDDHRNQRFAHAERVGDAALLDSVFCHGSNSGDVIVAYLGFAPEVQPQLGSMNLVSGSGNPLQIGDDVVGFDAINVVDLRQIEWIGDERCGHEPMNESPHGLSVFSQACIGVLFVSPSSDTGSDDLPLSDYGSPVLSKDGPIKASHTPQIADFVRPFKASDASPFFVNHLMLHFAMEHSIVLSSTTQGGHQCRFH